MQRNGIGSATIVEGDTSKRRVLRFPVMLAQSSTGTVSVAYETVDGSATRLGGDYSRKRGKVRFRGGTTESYIDVKLKGDTVVEGNETFTIALMPPPGLKLMEGYERAVGTIVDDDPAPTGPPRVAFGDVTKPWKYANLDATASLTLDRPSTTDVTVQFEVNGPYSYSYGPVGTGSITIRRGQVGELVRLSYALTYPENRDFTIEITSVTGDATAVRDGSIEIGWLPGQYRTFSP